MPGHATEYTPRDGSLIRSGNTIRLPPVHPRMAYWLPQSRLFLVQASAATKVQLPRLLPCIFGHMVR